MVSSHVQGSFPTRERVPNGSTLDVVSCLPPTSSAWVNSGSSPKPPASCHGASASARSMSTADQKRWMRTALDVTWRRLCSYVGLYRNSRCLKFDLVC